jgi:hypothetical protein
MATRKHHYRNPIFWIFWPFKALWMLIASIVGFTGRLIALIIGFVFIVVGIIVSLTIVGAIVGIPLAIVGFLMVLRGIF